MVERPCAAKRQKTKNAREASGRAIANSMRSVGDAIRDSAIMKGKAASIAMQLKIAEMMLAVDAESSVLMCLMEEAKLLGEAETKDILYKPKGTAPSSMMSSLGHPDSNSTKENSLDKNSPE